MGRYRSGRPPRYYGAAQPLDVQRETSMAHRGSSSATSEIQTPSGVECPAKKTKTQDAYRQICLQLERARENARRLSICLERGYAPRDGGPVRVGPYACKPVSYGNNLGCVIVLMTARYSARDVACASAACDLIIVDRISGTTGSIFKEMKRGRRYDPFGGIRTRIFNVL